MKNIFKKLVAALFILAFLGIIFIELSLPKLPANASERIEKTIQTELQTLKGTEGYASNGDIKLWYESILPQDSIKGTILLIMGIGNDAMAWPNYFVHDFVDKGYQVIRMDNRDTGMSTWLKDWKKENAYTLEDMALDIVAVLDELKIEKTNIVGLSLGGMIAQTFAIQHPNRLNTLTSVMSSGHMLDEDLPSINMKTVRNLTFTQLKYGIFKSETNSIKRSLVARTLLQGSRKYDLDVEDIGQTVLYNIRKRKGMNSNATPQQAEAVVKSGSRYEDLKKLTVPTLIVHGTSDPLIDFSHGEKCFEIIPNAEKLWVDGMGHDVPDLFGKGIIDSIVDFVARNSKLENYE